MGTLRIVAWNCHTGRSDDAVGDGLRNLINDLDPDVLCLQEATNYTDVIKARFDVSNGGAFRCYWHKEWAEANQCPVLVHKRFNAKTRGDPNGWNTIRCTTKWTGPNGNSHAGRTWTWVKVDSRYVVSIHRATGYKGQNKPASKDEYAVLCDWLEARDDQRIVVLGDHNMGPKEASPYWTSKCAANYVHGSTRYDQADPGIDYAICRNQQADQVKRKGSYGSDHRAVLLVASA